MIRTLAFMAAAAAVVSAAHAADAVTVNTGDVASSALAWVATVATGVVGTAVTTLLVRWFTHLGVQVTDEMRARLQDIVVNGLNLAAKELEQSLIGKGQVEVKNAVAARTVRYVQEHGADTLKALGLDPMSPAATEAIRARIETAITDPRAPTPPSITPIPTANHTVNVTGVGDQPRLAEPLR